MKWKLRWTLYASGAVVPRNEHGLRNLQECRARLYDIRRDADGEGFMLLDAHAMPELAGGTVRLIGVTPMGVSRCGAV